MVTKGPSQKYLEANEVKYFSLGGEGVGDFMVTISPFFKKKFETVPKYSCYGVLY